MKLIKNQNVLLTACVLILVVICWLSVESPLRFERHQAEREQVVKTRLIKIRAAEEHYRQLHGSYTDDFNRLTAAKLLADSLKYIPYGEGQKFLLTTSTVIGKSGKQISLMECSATYDQYLKGLDQNSISNLTEEANTSGRFPGLKIGDIETPNGNAGNWE